MASTTTTTKTIRIKNETAEFFQGKALNRAVDSLCERLKSGALTFDGEDIGVHTKGESGLPHGIKRETLDDLATMCTFMGGSMEKMLQLFDEAANSGDVYYEGGRLVGRPPIDLDRFLEKCREVGADPQKVLDKATAGIR